MLEFLIVAYIMFCLGVSVASVHVMMNDGEINKPMLVVYGILVFMVAPLFFGYETIRFIGD